VRFSSGIVVVIASAAIAHANPAAEKFFQDGRAAMKANKLPEACEAFRRSAELEAKAGTLLNLAACEEKRGRIATAWEAFVRAKTVAKAANDTVAAAEAEKRSTALFAKLPGLTVKQPSTRPPGFEVKRDGKPMLPAELDHEVVIDPGSYVIEASAPGHTPSSQTASIAVGQKLTIEIAALVADPSVTTAPATAATAPTTTTPPIAIDRKIVDEALDARRAGIGGYIGITTTSDLSLGIRFPLQIAPLGKGAIRAVPAIVYVREQDRFGDTSNDAEVLSLGGTVEYAGAVGPRFGVAAGLGGGVDIKDESYNDYTTRYGFGVARVSPTFKIGRAIDLAFHIQLKLTSDDVIGIGEVGVDYYFY
jgi:hypothetical protein